MKYTEETIKTDFSYRARDHYNQGLIELLNLYYDRIKNMPIDEVKKLLPIDHHGYNGTYLEDWMIREAPHTTKRFPFSIIGDIWSWYGDKTTSSVVFAAANSKEELYRKLLIQYLDHLYPPRYDGEKEEFDKIVNAINKY